MEGLVTTEPRIPVFSEVSAAPIQVTFLGLLPPSTHMRPMNSPPNKTDPNDNTGPSLLSYKNTISIPKLKTNIENHFTFCNP